MPTIAEDATFTQVIHFDVGPAKQDALIQALVSKVERWVRHRPGFVSSTFHASLNDRHILNYAQWRTQADFEAFTQYKETDRLGAVVRAVGPSGGLGSYGRTWVTAE